MVVACRDGSQGLAEMDHEGLQRWITRLTDGCNMEESEVLLIG